MTPARVTAIAILLLAAALFAVGTLAERANRNPRIAPGDAEIALLAADLLQSDPTLEGQKIAVEAFGDLLVLRGSVRSLEARDAAVHLARRVPGVHGVYSEIHVTVESTPAAPPVP